MALEKVRISAFDGEDPANGYKVEYFVRDEYNTLTITDSGILPVEDVYASVGTTLHDNAEAWGVEDDWEEL